jgi:hypothetical protein
MTKMLTLVVPAGAEAAAISHGTREYKPFRADHLDPSSLWLVRMPPDVADHYLRGNTGFYLMPEQAMSDGPEMIRMRHPEGGSCGWGSIAYEPDEHGVVTVPAAAVPDLVPHGFRPVPDETAVAEAEVGEVSEVSENEPESSLSLDDWREEKTVSPARVRR